MSANSFGRFLTITTFGESHGPAVGVIVDGLPPELEISEAEVQKEMDRRRPGQSDLTTPRKEADRIAFLSGIFEGKTTGAPMAMMLRNTNTRSSDYGDIVDKFRPGHADFTYLEKYGFRDWRGSGRASGRETAARVAAGAVARKWLSQQGVEILAFVKAAAGIECNSFDADVIEKNPMRACDPEAAEKMAVRVRELMEEGCVQLVGEDFGDQKEFSVGQVLFVLRSSSGLPFFRSAVDQDGVGFRWDVTHPPFSGKRPVVNVYGASLAVGRTTPRRQLAAWLFVKWFTQPEQQALLQDARGDLRMTHRPQVDGVEGPQLGDLLVTDDGDGGPLRVPAGREIPIAADVEVLGLVVQADPLGHGLKDLQALGHHLRAGAVSTDDRNPHSTFPSCAALTGRPRGRRPEREPQRLLRLAGSSKIHRLRADRCLGRRAW